MLDLPEIIIQSLLDDNSKTLALIPTIFETVSRMYHKHIAMVDPLTGLANRAAFMATVRKIQREASTYSILFLDLDKFKPVNDTFGHDAGDQVLQGVAVRLRKECPKNATISRLGGDEYCVLLPETSYNQAKKHSNNLQKIMTMPFKITRTQEPIIIGASIGVATYPHDGIDPEKLLAKADASMYNTKHTKNKLSR